jgi:hypothetical protein
MIDGWLPELGGELETEAEAEARAPRTSFLFPRLVKPATCLLLDQSRTCTCEGLEP